MSPVLKEFVFSPALAMPLVQRDVLLKGNLEPDDTILEAWGQGFNVGALVLLILIVLCNYKNSVMLHKLILLELFCAMWHGIFIFFNNPQYSWILSGTATLLYISYQLHNVVSWYKIRPFLPKWGGLVFIISLIMVQPYWILSIWANFQYFNNLGSDIFVHTRSLEALFRDPWWIFTTCRLVWVIKKNYEFTLPKLIRTSPRFGVMLCCMFLSIVFLVTDIAWTVRSIGRQSGINPFWRLALVMKCASDTIFLDDFKSVLDGIVNSAFRRMNGLSYGSQGGTRKGSTPFGPLAGTQPRDREGPVVIISSGNKQPTGPSWYHKVGFGGRRESGRTRTSTDEKTHTAMDLSHHAPERQIQAETTVVVSEHPGGSRSDSTESGERFGSQDNILREPDLTYASPDESRWDPNEPVEPKIHFVGPLRGPTPQSGRDPRM